MEEDFWILLTLKLNLNVKDISLVKQHLLEQGTPKYALTKSEEMIENFLRKKINELKK